jgi:enterobacteria phage integrase
LPKDPTSEEFMAAYQAALLGQSAPVRDRLLPAQPGSIAALIASYMRSAEYIRLRDTSKMGYISRLEMLRTEHGHRTVAGLSRERIVAGILQPYADRSGAALDTLKKLRILIRHAINIGWRRRISRPNARSG